jgi:hypothetical protein
MKSDGKPLARSDFPGLQARRLSALARAGFEIVSQPGAETSFLVQHAAIDRPGLLLETVRKHPGEWGIDWTPQREGLSTAASNPSFSETVTASINGASFIAVTALSNTPPGSALGEPSQYSSDKRAVRFRRASTSDPTFLYDLAYVFEALLIIDPERSDVNYEDAMLLRDLLEEVSGIASSKMEVPILALHFPAQVPNSALTEDTFTEVRWPLASSLALRVSFALSSSSSSERLRLAKHLVDLCKKHNIGLAVRDPGPGSRSGNWRCLDKARPRRSVSYNGADLHCLPATFVGPARVGSSHAIIDYIRRWSDVAFTGCSIVSLNDLAFVHLQLCVRNSPYFERVETADVSTLHWWEASAATPMTLSVRVDKVMNELSRQRPTASSDRETQLVKKANDYHSFFGYPFSLAQRDRSQRRFGIWFSWLTRRDLGGLEMPLSHLQDSLDSVLGLVDVTDTSSARGESKDEATMEHSFNVEYLLCREVGEGRLRATGKLSIDQAAQFRLEAMFPDDREPTASKAARAIEDEWRSRVERNGPALIELTVAWRELWLGHWSAPA